MRIITLTCKECGTERTYVNEEPSNGMKAYCANCNTTHPGYEKEVEYPHLDNSGHPTEAA